MYLFEILVDIIICQYKTKFLKFMKFLGYFCDLEIYHVPTGTRARMSCHPLYFASF